MKERDFVDCYSATIRWTFLLELSYWRKSMNSTCVGDKENFFWFYMSVDIWLFFEYFCVVFPPPPPPPPPPPHCFLGNNIDDERFVEHLLFRSTKFYNEQKPAEKINKFNISTPPSPSLSPYLSNSPPPPPPQQHPIFSCTHKQNAHTLKKHGDNHNHN